MKGILSLFFKKIFIYLIYECSASKTSACLKKRASDPPVDGCEPPCGCWELNPGPLEEQSVFLTTDLSPSPPNCIFLREGSSQTLQGLAGIFAASLEFWILIAAGHWGYCENTVRGIKFRNAENGCVAESRKEEHM